jgi:hypothetical protein
METDIELGRLMTLITTDLMQEMSDEQIQAAALKIGARAANEDGPARKLLLAFAQTAEDYIRERKN